MGGKTRGLGRWTSAAAMGPVAMLGSMVLASMMVCRGVVQAQQPAAAPDTASLVFKGEVKEALRLSLADLNAMAGTKVTADHHDGGVGEYVGIPLQELLLKAGVPHGHELRGKEMILIVVAEGADGYRAVFSLAELDADFAGAQVFVALTADGKPLDAQHGPLRLVVPGDKRQGRWVRMLKSISVQRIGEPK